MSIRQFLTSAEMQNISNSDRTYLKRKLSERCALSRLLNKPVNQRILHELQCLLDSKPLPRQKPGQFIRGQVSRLTDGIKHPCTVRSMTDEERVRYGLAGGV